MNAKDIMRKAHREAAAAPEVATSKPLTVAKQAAQGVKPAPTQPRPAAPQAQSISYDEVPTPVSQIARPDISLNLYGINSWKSNFNIYNEDIVNFVRNFSSENQLNGRNAITKSQMIEVLLDFAYYDLELRPDGFQSPQELREHLQEKLR